MLTPIGDLDRFRAAPIGRCYVGPSHAVWCAAPDLWGAIQWGVIDDGAAGDTAAMLALAHTAKRTVILDWRDIERVDGEAAIAALGLGARSLARAVVVLPPGLPRVLLAGALVSLAGGAPPRFAATRDDAAAAHPLAAAALASAVGHAATARRSSSLVSGLGAVLRHDLACAEVGDCADRLGMSPRTLQRLLAHHGTTFSAELRRARVRAAFELLENRDDDDNDVRLADIAIRAGFGTTSRLSAALRREGMPGARAVRARARLCSPPDLLRSP